MRREHISYMNRIPINIELLNIQDYPIHWHQSIEILMILKGSVNVTIESDTYKLIKNEIEIINLDEAHRIFSNEDNLVLLMHIDANFLQRYYDDIKNIYFYTDCSFEGEPQVGERYDLLKKYLSIILCETLEQGEDYNLYIKETLVELLYLLINEFHYLIYENKDLKDDVEQLQRYHRIAKYIYNNYNNKISLQDIAKKEFLSAHYLSNEIKNALGINFQDFVNLTRAEESVKLLLDTDMTISEIWAVMMIYAEPIIGSFVRDKALLQECVLAYRIMISIFPTIGLYYISTYVYQAMGEAKMSFLLSIYRQLVLFIPIVILFVKQWGVIGAWIAYPAVDVIAATTGFIYIRRVKEDINEYVERVRSAKFAVEPKA